MNCINMRGIHPTAAEIHICPGPVQCQFFGPSESLTTSATLQLGTFAFLYQPTSARPRKLLPIPYQAPVRITPQHHVALLSLQRRRRRPEARGARSGPRRRPTKRVPRAGDLSKGHRCVVVPPPARAAYYRPLSRFCATSIAAFVDGHSSHGDR